MSFTSEGFAPFPNFYQDDKDVGSFSALSPEGLDWKTNEYGAAMQRQDLMPRARRLGERILEHLLFELAYRDGIYDETIKEDELCDEQ